MRDPVRHPTDAARRRFLKQACGAGMALGAPPLLVGCLGSAGDAAAAPSGEPRTYFFNLSNARADAQYYLVAGGRHAALARATAAHLEAARRQSPGLPAEAVTHVAEAVSMPARELQVCFIKGVHGAGPDDWHMHSFFHHVPSTGTRAARALAKAECTRDAAAVRQAFAAACAQLRGAQPLAAASNACTDPSLDDYKDYIDHAVSMICTHPEIGAFDPATLAYIQQNIICPDPTTLDLAVSLFRQGAAGSSGGWATLTPYVDPTTGLTRVDANGQTVCYTTYSAETSTKLGTAIQSVLPKVKDDPQLGANISDMATTSVNTGLQGKMWTVRDGTPTATATPVAQAVRRAVATSSIGFAATDVSSGNGFRVTNIANSGRTVSFTVQNWYLRYLGLYARFLDGAGNPIALSALPSETTSQFFGSSGLQGTYDGFLGLVNQEMVVLAIPIKQASQDYSITLPDSAASVMILAGGLGTGTKSYPDTVLPGAVMTVVLDIALPGLFLVMAAGSAYATFVGQLSTAGSMLVSTAQIFITAITDAGLVGRFGDPSTFLNLIPPVATTLLKGAKELYTLVSESLAEGEAEGAAEDMIPFGIGLIIQACFAAVTIKQIAMTSQEVANSPWTYPSTVTLTHDVTVTINPDPLDTAGFPATATHYRLTAVCDGASPRDSGLIAMPSTTQTAPLTYTFSGLPSGGNVNISVAFTSGSGWLAGAGTTGAIANTTDTASITIKESLVPLTTTTVYGHKQKTAFDGSGNRVWTATTTPPGAPALSCANQAGSLCDLVGITKSEPFAAIGYAWESYSSGVTSYATGAQAQLYQFANIATTQNPQDGYMSSGKGFPVPARIAYDRASASSHSFYIDTSGGANIVRRINMAGVGQPPTIDAPGSNLAVGQFNFASDAFVIHPTGKLVSFNSELGKMEVLTPGAAGPDASAPLAQAYSGPGTRDGLLLGPVCAAVAHDGTILVIEQANNRIQAFDTGANPAPVFAGSSVMPLKARASVRYLDLAVEFTGFLYVLLLDNTAQQFLLDIYTKDGQWLCTTTNIPAAKLAIDLFRNVYTLNYEPLVRAGNVEPSVSEWIPSTPAAAA